jgi:putative membrane protein insertion efficiency factor
MDSKIRREKESILGYLITSASACIHGISGVGACCGFVPSCSVYTREAIRELGFQKGIFLALKRILRCHPLQKGGWDPVPKGVNNGT